jgi:hypothetical protein
MDSAAKAGLGVSNRTTHRIPECLEQRKLRKVYRGTQHASSIAILDPYEIALDPPEARTSSKGP